MCCLIKLLPYIVFEEYRICVLALMEMASPCREPALCQLYRRTFVPCYKRATLLPRAGDGSWHDVQLLQQMRWWRRPWGVHYAAIAAQCTELTQSKIAAAAAAAAIAACWQKRWRQNISLWRHCMAQTDRTPAVGLALRSKQERLSLTSACFPFT